MKDARRQILEDCLNAIQEANETLQEVRDEEEEAYDNLPESMQDGERGEMMQEAIDNLDEATCSLDDAVSSLEEAISYADNEEALEIDPWQKVIVGDKVTHKTYGQGKVITIVGDHFTIEFAAKTAVFIFPDAIDRGFITL